MRSAAEGMDGPSGSRTAFGSEIDARPRSRGESGLAGHLLLLAAVLALSAAYVYLYLFCQTLGGDQWNALAAMGQAIGAWATSVSFVVLIASLLSQRRQLRLQQEAVEVQFQELRNQGSSLEQTASAIAAQLFLQVLEFRRADAGARHAHHLAAVRHAGQGGAARDSIARPRRATTIRSSPISLFAPRRRGSS